MASKALLEAVCVSAEGCRARIRDYGLFILFDVGVKPVARGFIFAGKQLAAQRLQAVDALLRVLRVDGFIALRSLGIAAERFIHLAQGSGEPTRRRERVQDSFPNRAQPADRIAGSVRFAPAKSSAWEDSGSYSSALSKAVSASV